MSTPDYYDQGVSAGLAGVEVWCNPNAGPTGGTRFFMEWFAGWCQGMQLRALQQAAKLEKETPP